jgi:type I restriction enzyme S subunit
MKNKILCDSQDKVTNAALEDGLELYPQDSILIVVRSGILRRHLPVAINKVQCTVNQDIKVLNLFDKSLVYYVSLLLQGFENYILEKHTKKGTTVESIVFDTLSRQPFIFPPENEIPKIISKVNSLMSLCDQLEARLQAARQTQAQFALETVNNLSTQ